MATYGTILRSIAMLHVCTVAFEDASRSTLPWRSILRREAFQRPKYTPVVVLLSAMAYYICSQLEINAVIHPYIWSRSFPPFLVSLFLRHGNMATESMNASTPDNTELDTLVQSICWKLIVEATSWINPCFCALLSSRPKEF